MKVRLVLSMVVLLLFAAVLFALDRGGKEDRRFGEVRRISDAGLPVHLVRRTTDVYALWKERGVSNRVVVHLGKFLHFVELDPNQGYRTVAGFPVRVENLLREYEAKTTYQNFLWTAVETNIARKTYLVLPPAIYKEKWDAISREEAWLRGKDGFVTQYFGSLKIIADRIPREREPVLLNIDASFLDSPEIGRFVRELRRSGLLVDVVTLCLSEESPDVTPVERERLMQVAELLKG